MTTAVENNKRIAKNTLLLYIRMLLIMCVTLYTSRVILNALGVEDFGIYNVIGGVVTLFSFLNGTIAAATQRFLAYAIGKKDNVLLQKTFSQTFIIHVAIAIIILIIGESAGYWFVINKLVIPIERLDAAVWVFHCSLLTLVFNLLQVPYNSMIIAQEKMNIYAYFSVIEALLKLLVALSIVWLGFDRLKLYGFMLLIAGIVIALLYGCYCRAKFQIKLHWIWDAKLCRNLVGFAGWNLSAQLAWIGRTQGVNILLNMFFGPALNAARGLAVQVCGAVTSFVYNFQTAVNPQIVKNYAQGNLESMRTLIYNSSKFSFLLLSMLVIPLILECDTVLLLWIKTVPDYTVSFVQLSLISILVDSLSGTLLYGALATGKIKQYQIFLSILFLCNPIIVYVLLKQGFHPDVVYWVEIFFNLIALGFRLYFLRKLIGISVRTYLYRVSLICVIVFLGVISLTCLVQYYFPPSFVRLIVVTLTSIIGVVGFGYLIGLNSNEKKYVNQFIKEKIKKE